MPCFSPLAGYYAKEMNPNGKRSIVFDPRQSWSGVPLQLPCGQCIGCRLERSRQWAVRCLHEAKMSSYSSFVTLTYDDEHLPHGNTLVKRDLQLFMKRLRKAYDRKIRFYACGEYGELTSRPHYHLLLFNCTFPDRKLYAKGKSGTDLFRSDFLRAVWDKGDNRIGEVTFQSCAYVSRYILKKRNGNAETDYLTWISPLGEVFVREPEFTVMSRKPGIGGGWFDKYYPEVFAYDSVITNGREAKVPKYYDNRYELLDFERLQELKKQRKLKALAPNRRADNTRARLRVREAVEQRKVKDRLTRGL